MTKTMTYNKRQLLKDFFSGPINPGDFVQDYRSRRVIWAELRPDGLFDVSLAAGGLNTPLGTHQRENLEALAAEHGAGRVFIEEETTAA